MWLPSLRHGSAASCTAYGGWCSTVRQLHSSSWTIAPPHITVLGLLSQRLRRHARAALAVIAAALARDILDSQGCVAACRTRRIRAYSETAFSRVGRPRWPGLRCSAAHHSANWPTVLALAASEDGLRFVRACARLAGSCVSPDREHGVGLMLPLCRFDRRARDAEVQRLRAGGSSF